MKKSVRFLSVVMAICMLMSMAMPTVLAVGISYEEKSAAVSAQSDAGQLEAAEDNKQLSENKAYNEGVVLVKYEGELDETILAQAGLVSATALYNGSDWYIAELCSDANTAEEVARLRGLELFDEVELCLSTDFFARSSSSF